MFFKTKLHKTYNLIIKIVIILMAYGFIYNRIFHKEDFHEAINNFANSIYNKKFILLLCVVFALMIVNWGIESGKWRYLIKKIESISFLKAYKAILAGNTVSIFTPNRVGEFFGRVFILKKTNPWEGIFITVIGSMSQLLVTIVVGSIGFIFFITKYYSIDKYLSLTIIFVIIILNLFLILLFFNVSFISTFTRKFIKDKWKRIRIYMRIFAFYNTKELLAIFSYSFIRYCVFTLQFYILLRMFNLNIPIIDGVILISVVFFILTAIPSIALSELGIRGAVAISVFELYFIKNGIMTDQIEIAIISTTSLLWLINLAIPALVGTIFVFNLNFFRKNSN
ncbi:MAG: flippase-like domain-containing protein [Saprospiraceae bacterium]|nr:flippase-like domain-containing protein [Saprospiraceae bacterium]